MAKMQVGQQELLSKLAERTKNSPIDFFFHSIGLLDYWRLLEF